MLRITASQHESDHSSELTAQFALEDKQDRYLQASLRTGATAVMQEVGYEQTGLFKCEQYRAQKIGLDPLNCPVVTRRFTSNPIEVEENSNFLVVAEVSKKTFSVSQLRSLVQHGTRHKHQPDVHVESFAILPVRLNLEQGELMPYGSPHFIESSWSPENNAMSRCLTTKEQQQSFSKLLGDLMSATGVHIAQKDVDPSKKTTLK